MANTSPVHVEYRENGWAVIRQGTDQPVSVHPTQAEAAKEGRDIARREETEFFLHAQDGRVREHHSYGEGSSSTDQGLVGRAGETVDAAVTGVTNAVAQTLGAKGSATRGEEKDSGRKTDQSGEVESSTAGKGNDRSRTPEERYAGHEVYDQDGERIGKPSDLFVDENDEPEYVGVRTGSSGTRSALIPADVVTVDDRLRRMVVSRPRHVVETGPTLGYDEEVTTELERRVRSHYGLATPRDAGSKRGYGAYYRDDAERAGSERGGSGAQTIPSETGVDEDELRVRRSEEELRIGTRERETGAVRIRKRVRTDRERILVPKKRVEVTVERVPVEREAVSTESEAPRPEIREDEIVVPVVEEEVVVEKRPVVKEEIRIRKKVIEETEVVEEDIRREEVEVDDETERENAAGGST
jgi:uncharacterized protein (TIGR02271 family)